MMCTLFQVVLDLQGFSRKQHRKKESKQRHQSCWKKVTNSVFSEGLRLLEYAEERARAEVSLEWTSSEHL